MRPATWSMLSLRADLTEAGRPGSGDWCSTCSGSEAALFVCPPPVTTESATALF